MKKKKWAVISVRVSAEILNELEAMAKADSRPCGNLIRLILEQAVEANGEKR